MARSYSFTVLLFAMLREQAGDSIVIDLPREEITVQELIEAGAAQFPRLAPWLPHSKVAVNQAYAAGDTTVRPTDEIAFIPPVAGG
jgi:molybdopterin synthase catalytic subunit